MNEIPDILRRLDDLEAVVMPNPSPQWRALASSADQQERDRGVALAEAGMAVVDDGQAFIDKTEFVIKLATLRAMAPSDDYRSAIGDVLRNFGLASSVGTPETGADDG